MIPTDRVKPAFDKVNASNQQKLENEDAAIRAQDQARVCAITQRIGALGHLTALISR